MKEIFGIRTPFVLPLIVPFACWFLLSPITARAQANNGPSQPGQVQKHTEDDTATKELAAKQIRAQERQRILGVVPEFNTTSLSHPAPLTPKQKFSLAFKTATDPVTIFISAVNAGVGQLGDSYHEYGQGTLGFTKYLGAAYADSFDGTMLGNAFFPSLLHEDPRYFRKKTGSFKSRFAYSLLSTVRCKDDSGKWVPNVGNVFGNLAAGGIANLYYPSEDRGVDLTFERAFLVTGEGAIGALLYEFWPDIAHRLHKKKH